MIFSSRKTISTLIILLFSLFTLSAQDFSGRIISSQGGEKVPFANILVKGTTIGVASNAEGEFTITIPQEFQYNMIRVSAVGFADKELPIADLSPLKVNVIVIQYQGYKINEVDVEALSKVMYGAIKKCIEKIPKNYVTEPYSCNMIYSHNAQKATGIYTDETGYERTTFKESYKNITYQFDKGETKNTPYFSGKTNMEDLLSFDLVRTVGNIIDKQNVYDFKLQIDIKNTNKKQWAIHFTLPEPLLYNTGDAHAISYEGELFIQKENFIITRINVRGTSEKRSIHGKSIIVSDKSSSFISDLSYDVTCSYKEINGKYRMDQIQMKESFKDSNGKSQHFNSSLQITTQKDQVVPLEGRDYFVENL